MAIHAVSQLVDLPIIARWRGFYASATLRVAECLISGHLPGGRQPPKLAKRTAGSFAYRPLWSSHSISMLKIRKWST